MNVVDRRDETNDARGVDANDEVVSRIAQELVNGARLQRVIEDVRSDIGQHGMIRGSQHSNVHKLTSRCPTAAIPAVPPDRFRYRSTRCGTPIDRGLDQGFVFFPENTRTPSLTVKSVGR